MHAGQWDPETYLNAWSICRDRYLHHANEATYLVIAVGASLCDEGPRAVVSQDIILWRKSQGMDMLGHVQALVLQHLLIALIHNPDGGQRNSSQRLVNAQNQIWL